MSDKKPKLTVLKFNEDKNLLIVKHDPELAGDKESPKGLFNPMKGDVLTVRISQLGKCVESAFLDMLGVKEEIDDKSRRNFAIGNIMEPIIADWMREKDWEVKHNDKDAIGLIQIFDNGALTGHHDFYCRHPKETNNKWIVADAKTMSEKYFGAWVKNGTKIKYPDYYHQSNMYSSLMGTAVHSIIGFKKPDSLFDGTVKELEDLIALYAVDEPKCLKEINEFLISNGANNYHIDMMKQSNRVAHDDWQKVDNILMATEFFKGKNAEAWKCNYCKRKDMCHESIKAGTVLPKSAFKGLPQFIALLSEKFELIDDKKLITKYISGAEYETALGEVKQRLAEKHGTIIMEKPKTIIVPAEVKTKKVIVTAEKTVATETQITDEDEPIEFMLKGM